MPQSQINLAKIFNEMPFGEDKSPCGYFADKESNNLLTNMSWLDSSLPVEKLDCIFYGRLLHQGFRRYYSLVYHTQCKGCKECIPIRICAKDFVPSKSQRRVLNKNQDVEVTVVTDPRNSALMKKPLCTELTTLITIKKKQTLLP